MPTASTPEQILLYGKRQPRLIHMEANVVAYFGNLFRQNLLSSASSVRIAHAASGVSCALPK